jgi:hypothetical protein
LGRSFLKLERVNGEIILTLGDGSFILFKKIWIVELMSLPYDRYCDFIRSNIYPAFSDEEKKNWNKATVSNRDLQAAVQSFSNNHSLIPSVRN